MNEKKVDTKFKPGNKMGKGRLPGSRNKVKSIRDIIGTEAANMIILNLEKEALSGNILASRILIERMFPPVKASTYVETKHVLNVITQEDANNALTKIMNDVANADLSLEEADQLMSLIQRKIDSTQLCIREELEILKERVQNRHDNP
jgi:hypothetical protein